MPYKLTGEKAHWMMSLPCMIRIHPYCETLSQGMRPGDPEPKQQSMEWRFINVSATQKEQPAKVQGQDNVVTAFFDNDAIIHSEFVPADQTVNVAFMESGC
ncbi:hypothetical protein PR048_024365 [Dryococelus australis]|uniref:Uncharacterized protein n=1 Tax=Dryococelus australis TaxID=614101 RepID=A0ABQ9GNH2_9NEOP|nr:hypothetical protein PR048_024365 [Dryococelus australis]